MSRKNILEKHNIKKIQISLRNKLEKTKNVLRNIFKDIVNPFGGAEINLIDLLNNIIINEKVVASVRKATSSALTKDFIKCIVPVRATRFLDQQLLSS